MMQVRKIVVLFGTLIVFLFSSSFTSLAFGDDIIPELTNRYSDLNDLQDSEDTSDNVVTTTRVGVLTSANRALDGVTVSFSGEVVGDVMNGDGEHKWLNVLGSDGSCVGVWVDNDMANRIANVGSYSTTGTKLQVRGIYSIDCSEHQGELDVHALDVRVLDSGGKIDHFVKKSDIVWGLTLSSIGFLLLVTFIVLRIRSDRKQCLLKNGDYGSTSREDNRERKRNGNR